MVYAFTWVAFVPALAIAGIGDGFVGHVCDNELEKIPFGLGAQLKGIQPMMKDIDKILNAPVDFMCNKDFCPCKALTDAEKKLWAKDQQTKLEKLDWTGDLVKMQGCVDKILADTDDILKALKDLPVDAMQGLEPSQKDPKNAALGGDDATAGLERVLNGIMMPIYKTIETKFGCQGFCKPGLLWMSKDIKEGPPTAGCGIVANEGIVYYFGGWGGWLLVISFLLVTLMCFSCCLYRRKLKHSKTGVTTVTEDRIDYSDNE